MSEVKRYLADEQYPGQYSARCDLVPASAYDGALSQLSALREELATARRNEHNSEVALKAAYQRQDELREVIANTDKTLFNKSLRLADAERRNVVLFGLLERWYTANCNDLIHVEDGAYRIVLDTNEALNKPEEAKS